MTAGVDLTASEIAGRFGWRVLRVTAWLLLALAVSDIATAAPRVVRVGVYDNPPKLQFDPDGRISGIHGDLLTAIAEREGWQLEPVACEWQTCLQALEAGELDLLPDVALTPERRQRYAFHEVPALYSWSQLYARPGLRIGSVRDLDGLRVALLAGSVQEEYLRTLATGLGLQVEWRPTASLDEAVRQVVDGHADAVATNHYFGEWIAGRQPLDATSLVFEPAQLYFAAPLGRNADLLAAIDGALRDWRNDRDSPYFAALTRWGAPLPRTGLPSAVGWLTAGALLALLLTLLLAAGLRREVARKTRSLRASEARLAEILDSVDALVFIKDSALRYTYANDKLCRLLERPVQDIVGKGDVELFGDEVAAALAEHDRQVLDSGERVAGEEVLPMPDGKQHSFYSVKLPLRDGDGRIHAVCGIATDISEQHELLGEIHELSYFDPLTHLPNRRQLLARLQDLLSDGGVQARFGALLLLNIDRFQALNDTRGHAAGDQFLQEVAQRVLPCLREGQSAARLGSDEFAFLVAALPPSSEDAQRQVATLAKRLLDCVAQPWAYAGETYHASCSIGIALFAGAGNSVEEILRRADLALSEARVAGGGRMRFFHPDMQSTIAARAALETDLRAGLAQQQFRLYYQPQVASDDRLLGFEALVRWQHPSRGLVPPASFIPLAEASGLIVPLGDWVLDEACRQMAAWRAGGPDAQTLRIAVNISARQLLEPDFVAKVLGALERHGLPAPALELEITETQLVENMDEAIAKLSALRGRGIRVALDDFGTGYSALSYVKQLPLDLLKIDTSFVRDLLLDPNDLAIVRTIVALGVGLDLEVLAEGVEDPGQREVLQGLGCAQFQGYLFAAPLPADEALAWLPGGGD